MIYTGITQGDLDHSNNLSTFVLRSFIYCVMSANITCVHKMCIKYIGESDQNRCKISDPGTLLLILVHLD